MNYLSAKLGRRGSIAAVAVLATALVSGAVLVSRPDAVTIPEGTALHVRLDHMIASDQSRPGEEFTATLAEPIVVAGETVIPEGSPVKGRVIEAKESGRLKGVSRLRLALTEIQAGENSYDLTTTSAIRVGGNHRKRNWWWIGGGGAGGTVIGAIAGGAKGALIGGPIGAGAGVTAAFLTGKKDIRLPAETPLTFKLSQSVKVEPVEVDKVS